MTKIHALDPGWLERGKQRPLCGVFGDCRLTDVEEIVDCSHCLRRLGRKLPPRWCTPDEMALIEAVKRWHASYVADRRGDARDPALSAAWESYNAQLGTRRHYPAAMMDP